MCQPLERNEDVTERPLWLRHPKEWLGACMAQSPPVLGSVSLRKVRVPGAALPLTTLSGRHNMWLAVSWVVPAEQLWFQLLLSPIASPMGQTLPLAPLPSCLDFLYLLPHTPLPAPSPGGI